MASYNPLTGSASASSKDLLITAIVIGAVLYVVKSEADKIIDPLARAESTIVHWIPSNQDSNLWNSFMSAGKTAIGWLI